jgi:hypothetical protein
VVPGESLVGPEDWLKAEDVAVPSAVEVEVLKEEAVLDESLDVAAEEDGVRSADQLPAYDLMEQPLV